MQSDLDALLEMLMPIFDALLMFAADFLRQILAAVLL